MPFDRKRQVKWYIALEIIASLICNVKGDIMMPPPPAPVPPPPPGSIGVNIIPPRLQLQIHPSVKMKQLQWMKLSPRHAGKSFWSDVEYETIVKGIDFHELEGVFGVQENEKVLKMRKFNNL
jgi:hypothetical protein